MKKILLALTLIGGMLTSCDMDKSAFGTLDDETGIRDLNDIENFTNQLYNALRSKTAGSWIYYQEIQMDLFHGLKDNGNNGGMFANSNILSSDQDIEEMWASLYSTISDANFIIEKIENMRSNTVDPTTDIELEHHYGEALFTRAFCYVWLADHFCQTYSEEKAGLKALGLPLVTKYHPSSDRSTYPGRSTLGETFDLIDSDLISAYNALKAYQAIKAPEQNDAYLNVYTVAALQARVALLKGDNATALAKAREVIESKVYELTGIAGYSNLWSWDTGSEVIFRPFMSSNELGVSTSSGWFLSNNEQSAFYIPTYDMISMYLDKDGSSSSDVRFITFFTEYNKLQVNGSTYKCVVFNKFPGNENLKTGTQRNFVNMMKPFRLSEMYLIAAEASAKSDPTAANKYLNDLRTNRIINYKPVTLSGAELMTAIKTERLKELIGEGFRMSDLRRWHQGFSRNPNHMENPALNEIINPKGAAVSYEPDDYRFVWPIPSAEIQSNPQLDGQQNPGYN